MQTASLPINSFNLKQQQYDFIGNCEQFPAYIGGIGTGKSFSLIAKALFHSQESENNLGVIIRKNFTDLRDSTIRDFEQYTGLHVSKDDKEVKLPNKSVIMFRHGDELPVLKNLNLGWFGIEQAEEFGDSLSWDMLIMRLRRNVKFRSGFLVANANGHNWIWNKWVKNGPSKNHALIQATTYDFADILPTDYITNLESNLPDKLFRRFVKNSHEIAEGLVFSEYDESRHVDYILEIPEGWERGFILDHGFRNPTAVLWYAIDFDGNIHLYDEHYECEKPISYHAERIKSRKVLQGIADPSIFSKTQSDKQGFHTIADEYSDLGIILNPAVREEEYAAIARVNEFFKAGRIKVSVNLTHARHEFSNWKWKPRRPTADPQNYKEEPEDYQNHLADCLKYLIQTRFAIPSTPQKKSEFHSFNWWERMAREKRIYG